MIKLNFHSKKIVLGLAATALFSSCQNTTSTLQNTRQHITEQIKEAIAEPSADEVAIASALLLVNKVHLNVINLSKEKLSSPKIHDLAGLLGNNLNQLTIESSYLSREIIQRHDGQTAIKIPALLDAMESDLETLKSTSASDYEKTFIDIEYNLHQTITQVIKNQLIPNCKNPELLEQLNHNMTLYQHQLELLNAAKEDLA